MIWDVKNSVSEGSNLHICEFFYFSEDQKLKFSYPQLSCDPHSHESFLIETKKWFFSKKKKINIFVLFFPLAK